jgi:hypothetical protein
MRLSSTLSTTLWLGIAIFLGSQHSIRAQVTQPTAAPDTAAVTAKPIEPIVPPIQRVKPAVPQLDPRLSGKPQTAPRSAASTSTVRSKYLATKATAKSKLPIAAPQRDAVKNPTGPTPPAPAKNTPQTGGPTLSARTPVIAKKPAKPSLSQAAPANPPANVKR